MVTTFKTAGTYKNWQWPNSAHIMCAWHALVLWHRYLHTYIYIYIYIAPARICTPLIVSRSLRSLANKYSTLPRGISINIAPKVGIFPEAEGRGKYSLPRVQYYRYSTRKVGIFILLHRLSLYNCVNLFEHQSSVLLDS